MHLHCHNVLASPDKEMAYLPDYIIYDLDAESYDVFWRELNRHPRESLSTDGLQIKRVNQARRLINSFKNSVGLTDTNQAIRVNMVLAKIAYVGYLNGFNSTHVQHLSPVLISDEFHRLVCQHKTNETTALLQNLLVDYYQTHRNNFPEVTSLNITHYCFGQAFMQQQDKYRFIAAIDLQDPELIQKYVELLIAFRISVYKTTYSTSSKFALEYASTLIQSALKARASVLLSEVTYKNALAWDSEIDQKIPIPFLYYYGVFVHKKTRKKG